MKTNKLSYVLFSLAIIVALFAAAIPMAPAHAMSAASTATTISSPASTTTLGANALVCKHVVKWVHGHRISVRVCHRVPKPDTN